eukprot:TRINITY_DN3971_c0_g1_i5.p1 TRINITY_DN3971_c0_g1~~TRINITY_DN3971_c0_g1_i5.p1  ORF type:complete len:356 (+),score=64.72 TRINITY_DN3971_c0_g1_i5:7-1074(+)
MNEDNFGLASGFISAAYVEQAAQARKQREAQLKTLLSQRGMPEHGWSEGMIDSLMMDLANMDSNNFIQNVGVGEREARVFCQSVARRHYRMAHGVGRSGDLIAEQPKASGSSLMFKLANMAALDALKLAGVRGVKAGIVVPMATGMSVALVLLALMQLRPPTARRVIWPRLDQKSCFKAIFTCGATATVIPNAIVGDEVVTDLPALEAALREGAEHGDLLCVLTTTSAFAPRAPDSIVEIAKACRQHNIPHVVNNAFGLQSSKVTHLLSEAMRLGRVDAIVQSTDKNFMVPVGGAIIAGPDSAFIERVSKNYPGRASESPVMDLFMTLLAMGKSGYTNLLLERKRASVKGSGGSR